MFDFIVMLAGYLVLIFICMGLVGGAISYMTSSPVPVRYDMDSTSPRPSSVPKPRFYKAQIPAEGLVTGNIPVTFTYVVGYGPSAKTTTFKAKIPMTQKVGTVTLLGQDTGHDINEYFIPSESLTMVDGVKYKVEIRSVEHDIINLGSKGTRVSASQQVDLLLCLTDRRNGKVTHAKGKFTYYRIVKKYVNHTRVWHEWESPVNDPHVEVLDTLTYCCQNKWGKDANGYDMFSSFPVV